MDLLLSCHRAPFNHHSTGLKAKWTINPRTDHVMDMRGRGCKAMSGNCCEMAEFPADNVDLERWFKGPKGHERRSHGHGHAGVRLVRQGPTLMLALDAPRPHDGPWTIDDLEPYGHARVPESQQQAIDRGTIMRQARSRKKRPVLLIDLEKRYLNAP